MELADPIEDSTPEPYNAPKLAVFDDYACEFDRINDCDWDPTRKRAARALLRETAKPLFSSIHD
jgi:hypothetical protein